MGMEGVNDIARKPGPVKFDIEPNVRDREALFSLCSTMAGLIHCGGIPVENENGHVARGKGGRHG